MATRLYLRNATWDTNRYQLSTTAGTGVQTKVVNTAANAEVQWTVSGGGSAIEWCSAPVTAQVTISSAVSVSIWAQESSMSANAGGRIRLYKVSNDRATWTEMGGGPFDDNVEFSFSSPNNYTWTATPTSNNTLSANERFGIRLFLDNNCGSALASGYTATLSHDAAEGNDGCSWVETVETLFTTVYTAPAATGGAVTSGTATTGYSRVFTAPAATGGAVTDGVATTGYSRVFTAPAATGGIVTGGTVAIALTHVPAVSGGAATGGTAATAFMRQFTATVTGGASLGGAGFYELLYDRAVVRPHVILSKGALRRWGPPPAARATAQQEGIFTAPTPTGGIVTSGTAVPPVRTWARDATGGIVTSGTAEHSRTWAQTGVGGAVTSGTATTSRTSTYTAPAATGGIVTSGTAVPPVRTWARDATGGAVTGGTAAIEVVHVFGASGSVVTGGAAAYCRTWVPTATGGIATDGTADHVRVWVPAVAGGLVTSGTAVPPVRTWARDATGGIVTSGAATTQKGGTWEYTGTGGIVTSGTAVPPVRTWARDATGGIVTGGVATTTKSNTFTAPDATGGIVTSGTAAWLCVRVPAISGGIVTGGAAAIAVTYVFDITGNIVTGGSASWSVTRDITGSGSIVTGGTATTSQSLTYTAPNATGGVVTEGTAAWAVTRVPGVAGGVVTSGSATWSRTWIVSANGGGLTGGAAAVARTIVPAVAGGIETGGAAASTLVRHYLPTGGIATGGSATWCRTFDVPHPKVQFVAVGTGDTATNAAVTPGLPACATGDVMLAVVSLRHATATVNTPAGWDVAGPHRHASQPSTVYLFTRTKQAGDSDPTFTPSDGDSSTVVLAQIAAFSLVESGEVFAVTASWTDSGTSAINIGPVTGVTATTEGTMAVLIGHRGDASTGSPEVGDLSGWTKIDDLDAVTA